MPDREDPQRADGNDAPRVPKPPPGAPKGPPRVSRATQRMFETRSQAWKEVGLLRQINPRVFKRARLEALVLVPLFVAVVVLYDNRLQLLGTRGPSVHGR